MDDKFDAEHASVSGEPVHRSKFAYVGDPSDKSTWKLPIHDESHVRNALARFGQTELPSEKKKEVARKLVRAAKAYGIDTSGFEKQYLSSWVRGPRSVPSPLVIVPPPLSSPGRNGTRSVPAAPVPTSSARTAPSSTGRGPRRSLRAEPRAPSRSIGTGQAGSSRQHFATLLSAQCFAAPIRRHGKELYEVPIAVAGSWVKADRKFSITREDLGNIVRNFEKRKNQQVVIDYEHASEMPEIARGGPIPAAGWIHSLLIRSLGAGANGNGHGQSESARPALMALIEWTPEAMEMIRNGQYRFFSPAIDWGARDKESGEPQGATLTSGALTNHPFLEELPPVMLNEFEISNFKLEMEEGGQHMAKKFLTAKRLDDEAGIGVFDEDTLLGVLDEEQLRSLWPPPVMDEGTMSELLAEQVGVPGASMDEIRKLIPPARALGTERLEKAARGALLAETLRDGRIDLDRAAALADTQKIGFAEYRTAEKASSALEEAVRSGKILPRDRDFYARIALSDPDRFAAWVRQASPVVNFTTVGLAAPGGENAGEEMGLRVKHLMNEKGISYVEAARLLALSEPELVRRYRASIGKVQEQ